MQKITHFYIPFGNFEKKLYFGWIVEKYGEYENTVFKAENGGIVFMERDGELVHKLTKLHELFLC